ncbi:MAG: hypothetical protein IJ473_01915, partial [Alphaproteobacteria bacterium]|nr:hypothetical protein [Alphaproteobacteria bacterium]
GRMKKLLLIALVVASGQVYAATTTQITNALAKYCVPKPNDYPYKRSRTTCDSVLEGKYTNSFKSETDGTFCTCYDNNYLVYDASLRRCKPKCGAGKQIKQVTGCGAGKKTVEIKR